jgi:hypothetical protein
LPLNWKLRVDAAGWLLRFDGMLDSLLRSARFVGLLHGQRNCQHETLLKALRNRAAHATGYRLLDPGYAAMAIGDLAEIINRLWGGQARREGVSTPRRSAARLRRLLGTPAARPPEDWPKDSRGDVEPDVWTCVLVRAALDEDLSHFDAQYEATRTPCELLWTPAQPRTRRSGVTCTALQGAR